jgi:hypothetical protein
VFAYFFLRLYKNGLEDIKYYQNEITNIDAKVTALSYISQNKNAALTKLVIESLAKTERNFRMKKGETTLGLERERLEKNELLDVVKEAIGGTRKG